MELSLPSQTTATPGLNLRVLRGLRRISKTTRTPAPWPAARLKVATLFVVSWGVKGFGQTELPGGIVGAGVGVNEMVGEEVGGGVFVIV